MTSVEVSESLEGELAVQFVDRVRACDTSRASDVMASAASLLDSHQFVFDFVLPTVRALGDASYTQSISRAEEQMGVNLIRSAILTYPIRATRRVPTRIVMATPANEFHEIGLLVAATLARVEGFQPIYLGTNLPWSQIRSAAEKGDAQIIILAMLVSDHVPPEIDGDSPQLWIGTCAGHPVAACPPTGSRVFTDMRSLARALRTPTVGVDSGSA